MKAQIQIINEPSSLKSEVFEKTGDNDGYKACPYCGQSKIPFKLGVCACGNQIGNIPYVNNPEAYAINWYSYIKSNSAKVQKLGIAELMDN